MAEEKKRKFLIHGGILAMAGIIVRIIGMLYRIPLVNIIGSDGNGVYSTAYNVYNIALVLSSYGLPMAVSKLVSAKFVTRRYKSAAKIFRCSLVIALCAGGTASLILFFGADTIERVFYAGVPGVAIPLRILAPTVFFVAVMGVMRGFYQGQGTTIPTAVSQLIEQVVNAVVSILAGYLLVNAYKETQKVAAYGAAGGTLGTAAGAFMGLMFLVILYVIYRPTFMKMVRHDKASRSVESKRVYHTIIVTMIPIIVGQTFYQISAVIDDIMFNNLMVGKEISKNIANDLGNFSSSYSLLIGVPQGIASALSAAMLPSIVASFVKNDIDGVNGKLKDTLKTNMFVAIPSFIGLAVLGQNIIQLLFPRYDCVQGGIMLKIGAVAVVFYTLSTVTSSALQGIDRMNMPVKHSFISLVVHVILVYILLKFTGLGIYAVVIGNASFPVLIFVLNIIKLHQYTGFRPEYKKTFIIPLACSIIMGIAVYVVYTLMHMIIGSNIISLIFAFIAAGISYFAPIIFLRKKRIY